MVEEQRRADRYHFQKDRDHFIVARSRLRSILCRYLKIEPAHLHLSYGRYGKPELAGKMGNKTLRFNVSHSQGTALYAVALGREVGIDLENISFNVTDEEIAKIAMRFFSPRDVAEFCALPVNMQKKAFITCWTRKEAYIKARGDGLSLSLDQFNVSLIPGDPPLLLKSSDGPEEAARWSLHELIPSTDYVAALAVEGHDVQLKCLQWVESLAGKKGKQGKKDCSGN